MFLILLIALLMDLPGTVVDHAGVRIQQSGTVQVKGDAIPDPSGEGVILIATDGVTVDFAGSRLHGALKYQTPDQFTGVGLRVTGKNVTVKNAKISGYKCAIFASGADGLTLENCDVSDNYAQHLKSTPKAEDGADWLYPHHNDDKEWMKQHGAGIYVERSTHVTIRNCRARHTQNGLLLDRVTYSKVYDNDFSFLSGWGLGMWRCEDNLISRNAFDFCIRGYSHGVYNRGQDSAGILFFEQNHRNVLVENSATHGGDGFFGFAGREALGEAWWEEQRDKLRKDLGESGLKAAREKLVAENGEDWKKRSDDEVLDQQIVVPPDVIEQFKRRGNCDNILAENDFSYAAAHGIELTFSFGNVIHKNRMTEDAICGVWGGYSQDTLIAENIFERDGEAGYGLERGGVNIEHGRGNVIRKNTFAGNVCGVHLWWDADEGLLRYPWAKANGAESIDNIIVDNEFAGDELALHLRQSKKTVFADNRMKDVKKEVTATSGSEPTQDYLRDDVAKRADLKYQAIGDKRPVGARKDLRGREKIVVTEWGPYDWQRPYLRKLGDGRFQLLGDEHLKSATATGNVNVSVEKHVAHPEISVRPKQENTAATYELTVLAGDDTMVRRGAVIHTSWDTRFFKNANDPRQDYDGWKRESEAADRFPSPTLDLKFGNEGPGSLLYLDKMNLKERIGNDHFGTLATTSLTMPAGNWRVTVTSDDGVHVFVDDKLLIDDWTWHPPKTESKDFTIDNERVVNFRVEHFELDGYAILSLTIEPAE